MFIQKTFERWLQQFDSRISIRKLPIKTVNEKTGEVQKSYSKDVEVLYLGKKRIGSIPAGIKGKNGWSNISDKRSDQGYETSDGIHHRGMTGIGLMLMHEMSLLLKLLQSKLYYMFDM